MRLRGCSWPLNLRGRPGALAWPQHENIGGCRSRTEPRRVGWPRSPSPPCPPPSELTPTQALRPAPPPSSELTPPRPPRPLLSGSASASLFLFSLGPSLGLRLPLGLLWMKKEEGAEAGWVGRGDASGQPCPLPRACRTQGLALPSGQLCSGLVGALLWVEKVLEEPPGPKPTGAALPCRAWSVQLTSPCTDSIEMPTLILILFMPKGKGNQPRKPASPESQAGSHRSSDREPPGREV